MRPTTASGCCSSTRSVPPEIEELAVNRETAIVLTVPWQERGAQSLVEQLGVPVYTPLPDTAEDLMQTWSLTAEQGRRRQPGRALAARRGGRGALLCGGRLIARRSPGVPGQKRNDMVLWVESHCAVGAGDTLADFGEGLRSTPAGCWSARV